MNHDKTSLSQFLILAESANLHLTSCQAPIHLSCSLSGVLVKKNNKARFPVKLTKWIENLWEPGSEPVFIISGHHNNFNLQMVQCIQFIFRLLTNSSILIFGKSHLILKNRTLYTSAWQSHKRKLYFKWDILRQKSTSGKVTF